MEPKEEKYFAAYENPIKDFITQVNRYINDFYEDNRTRGRLNLWRIMYNHFYKPKYTGGRVNKVGDQLEFKSLTVNHLANIVQHQAAQITQQAVSWDVRAVNTDIDAAAQAEFGEGLIQAEVTQKKLDDITKQAVFNAVLFGEGFVSMQFDDQAGDPFIAGEEPVIDPNTGEPIMEPVVDEMGQPLLDEMGGTALQPTMQPVFRKQGEVQYHVFHPIDVVKNIRARSYAECQWKVTRRRVNRWDLIIRYPNLKKEILTATDSISMNRDELIIPIYKDSPGGTATDSNSIYLWEFWHDKTDAVPDGRYTAFVGDDVVLEDTKLPYKKVPVFRVTGMEEISTPFGWTSMYDMSSIQDALNKLYSIVASNQLKWGVGVIFVPKGSNMSSSTLQKGMVVIEYDPRLGKPEAANFTLTPPEIFNFISQLESVGEKITAVSSVMRGDPEASIRSGNMLEIILAQNTNFYKGLEQSYNSFLEDIGTAFIQFMQQFADYERPTQIMGESGRYYTKYFTKDNLNFIDKVYVQRANPAQKTFAGKMAIANNLLSAGALKDPREYIQIINTGDIQSTIDPDTMDFRLIKEENAALIRGELPPVSPTDYQAAHGYHHSVVIANPEARANELLTNNTLQHLGEHALISGFILPPQMVPQTDPVSGEVILDEFGAPLMVQGPPQGDVVTYLNWCRMIMNAPPSGAMQMAQQALMMGANGMAPNAQKLEKPNTGVEK